MKETDIVIIGAGPAGCSTSLFLAKHKIPHTIIDKAIFPRDKVCGDALSGKTVYVLNQLDTSIVPQFAKQSSEFIDSWGVKFAAPNGKSIDIPFKKDISKEKYPPGFIAKRKDFDFELFKKLDKNFATIYEGTEVSDIVKVDGGYKISCKNSTSNFELPISKLVIGAEGDRSVVAKKLAGIKN